MNPRRETGHLYDDQLFAYMQRELHPETASAIGNIVLRSHLLSSETAMSIILQMKLDQVRKDHELLEEDIDNQLDFNFS